MDPKVPAPLSAAQGAPPPKAFLSHSGSIPIRAPPSDYSTDEEDKDVVVDAPSNPSSLDGTESGDGFLSGEEDFETASERPFAPDPDEDAVVEGAAEDKVGSFARGGGPFARSFSSSSSSTSAYPPSGATMPIAQLSGDDDDEVVDEELESEQGEEEAGDTQFSVTARVPPPLLDNPDVPNAADAVKAPIPEDIMLSDRPMELEDVKKVEEKEESTEITEKRVSVVTPENGVLGGVHEELSMAEEVSQNLVTAESELVETGSSEVDKSPLEAPTAIVADASIESVAKDNHNDDSRQVVDGSPEPEKRDLEVIENGDSATAEKEEHRLFNQNSEKEGELIVEKVVGGNDNEVLDTEPASGENSEIKTDSNVESKNRDLGVGLETEAANKSMMEDEAYERSEEKSVDVKVEELGVGLSEASSLTENFVDLISVANRDKDVDPEDSDQKLKSGGAPADPIIHESHSQESGEGETEECPDVGAPSAHYVSAEDSKTDLQDHDEASISSNLDYNGDKLDVELKSAASADLKLTSNEPILISAPDGEERYLETLEKNANAANNADLASNEDSIAIVEDANMKEKPTGHAPVNGVEEEFEEDGSAASDEHETLDASTAAVRIIKELEQGSTSSRDFSQKTDGQIVTDSDEEVDTDEEGDGKELFDSAALAALLKAASSAGADGSITISSSDGPSRFFSIERPAGLGPSVPTLKPTSRSSRPNIFTPSDLAVVAEDDSNMDEEEKKLQEKIHQIRVKFLRLVQRLGHSPEDTVAAQVLYRLNLAEGIRRGRHTNRAFSLETAKKAAAQLESTGKDDLDFSFNVLILGKTGVGKSATINSIFNEGKTSVSAFEPTTAYVKEIIGVVDGVKVRVIDTPGLKSSVMEQGLNRKTLFAVKKFTKKCPPDIVLYVDRLDTQTRDFNDIPLLRTISSVLGSSIWLNAIVALTHAASAPPDGPNGSPLSYEVFVAQRSHIVQHAIRQAAGDMRLMNPVALVENHPSCRKNREGQRILPNGQIWRPQLLLLCYSSKILSEANSLLKLQDSSASKLFGFRVRSPPLPFLLSSLLQSRAHPKLPNDQGGEIEDSDIDLAELSDSEQEGEDEYDQLPPFKPLKKAQIEKLSNEQRRAYFEEYDYRVKLLQKKQWREELKRLKELKKRGKEGQAQYGYGDMVDDFEQENGAPAAVPVPLPDMVLPPSFDGDNPGFRYRFLEPTSGLLARPVLDTHGWDHDCGYDGVSLENSLAIASQFPAAVSVQITKDKKEFNIHLDSSVSAKHGENGSSLAGFDIQTVGRQLAYILRGETKFKNLKRNKTVAGVSVTFLGENVATGLKVEDQIPIGKRVSLVGSTGAVRAQGDMAYGANLEARLKDKDFPVGQDQSTLGLSLMRWRGDLALGANLQSQFSIGRNSKVAVRVGLNNKLSGQITVRTTSSEQLQIALVGLIPIAATILRTIYPNSSYFMN